MKNQLNLLIILFGLGFSSHIYAQTYYTPLHDPELSYDKKDIEKFMTQAAETREERVKAAFETYDGGTGLRAAMLPLIANLYVGRDVKETNEMLQYVFTTENDSIRFRYRLKDPWPLNLKQYIYHMYYAFGSKGKQFPGRLYPETEKILLEYLWEHVKYQNDIHLSRQSTWWMIGSENHDIVSKVSSLISSQIFMNEPEYKDRVYPNPGKGGGYGFWFHASTSPGGEKGPFGRADGKDGKQYTAKDHYEAWEEYFHEFFAERAKKGFFLEMASFSYQGTTISYLTDINYFIKDEALKAKAKNFLDLFWTDWAQEQLHGVRGGAKTRESNAKRWHDNMNKYAEFFTGGKGLLGGHGYAIMFGDYKWPELVWKMALDREGRGEYASIRRQPGEEEGIMPRPLGTERTLIVDTESRFVRYSWITPDYIMGCQMDYPLAIHSHLSIQNRWQGITFNGKGEDGPRVYPATYDYDPVNQSYKLFSNGYQRCVQKENVMITQQSRGAMVINPDWFPAKPRADKQYGVYFGNNHDRIVEKGGWIFVQNGDAYLAVRPLLGEYVVETWRITKSPTTNERYSQIFEDSYTWSEDKSEIYLKDNYGGVIFETSRKAHYPTMEGFMEVILKNPIVLNKTVVPGFNVLEYTSTNGTSFSFNLANNEIPKIDGEYINYTPEKVFESPYINSKYNSGVVEVTYKDEKVTYNFE